MKMLWRILGNEQDVCDAYQNTFLQLAHYENGQKPEHLRSVVTLRDLAELLYAQVGRILMIPVFLKE